MTSILIIARDGETRSELTSRLAREGFTCALIPDEQLALEQIAVSCPDIVLLETSAHDVSPDFCSKIKQDKDLPILAIVDALNNLDSLEVDDFVLAPANLNEVVLRTRRLLRRVKGPDAPEVIRCGDLVIDTNQYEVTLSGSVITLTFMEYELLKFLASHRGSVFTREALLNKVWGYDYYGGDRTVDVHIRRLRSKIEDSGHAFIDTVRNIGYRFRSEL